jgi:acetamidase/formamidase
MIHQVGPPHVHTRWNNRLTPALEIESGDAVEFTCLDSSGGQVTPRTSLDEYQQIDRGRIHTITGPVHVRGARPGDVLEVRIRRVDHHGWGWTSIVPGLGSLPERFDRPYLFLWQLDGEVSRSMPGVTLPLAPFLGIMGVAPSEEGEFRTRPPGSFGGNLDVRQLVPGSTLYLPVYNDGALFSAGDGHAAQGDGEVCINGIEAPMTAELQLTVRRDFRLDQPFAELPPMQHRGPDLGSWAFIQSAENPMDAVRGVIHRAVDFLAKRRGLTEEQAYLLCSVALDLRISQCVNVPLVTVTGTLAKALFR